MVKLMKLIRDNKGATAIEYGLIAALIAVAGIAAFQAVGNSIKGTFNQAGSALEKGRTAASAVNAT